MSSLGGTGLKDWLVQRFTAIVLLLYTGLFVWFFAAHQPVTYDAWHGFLMHPMIKVATVLAFLSLSLHAWIGIWTVLTDYVHQTVIRYVLEMIVLITLIGYFIWGIHIIYQI